MEHDVVMVHKLMDAKGERLCCGQVFINQEVDAKDRVQGDGPSSESHVEKIYIKSDVFEAEMEAVIVKDEPIDWHQEPQASSSSGSDAVIFKKKVENDCAEARSGRAEAEDQLREGISGACNTSAVHLISAGAPLGSADSRPSDVWGGGSDIEATPPDRLMSRPLLCEHCHYSTGRRVLMELHLCFKHQLGCYYECEMCDFSTMYSSAFKRHVVEQQDNEIWYKCLSRRSQYSGVKMTREQRPEKQHQQMVKCEFCGSHLVIESCSETPKKGALNNSMVSKCEVCEKNLANEANLKQRLSGKRKIGLQTIEHGLGQFYMRKLNDHLSTRKKQYEVHQANKDGKGEMFKCELCDYSTAYKRNVKRHQASKHEKGKLFKCDLCEYFSAEKYKVKLHLASKHGKGPMFKCELCDFSSSHKGNVNQHLASKHGKGRMFKCELCDFFSSQKGNVKQHLASIHGIGHLFKCEFCNYSSAQKSKLKLHVASQHGKGLLFKCELCEYSSAYKNCVKRHQASNHGGH